MAEGGRRRRQRGKAGVSDEQTGTKTVSVLISKRREGVGPRRSQWRGRDEASERLSVEAAAGSSRSVWLPRMAVTGVSPF